MTSETSSTVTTGGQITSSETISAETVSTVGQHATGGQDTTGAGQWGTVRHLHRLNSQQADAGLAPREMTKLATKVIRKNRIRFRFMALWEWLEYFCKKRRERRPASLVIQHLPPSLVTIKTSGNKIARWNSAGSRADSRFGIRPFVPKL